MKKLTVEILEQVGTCSRSTKAFGRLFPNGTLCHMGDVKKWNKHGQHWPVSARVSLLSREGIKESRRLPESEPMQGFARAWRKGMINSRIK